MSPTYADAVRTARVSTTTGQRRQSQSQRNSGGPASIVAITAALQAHARSTSTNTANIVQDSRSGAPFTDMQSEPRDAAKVLV